MNPTLIELVTIGAVGFLLAIVLAASWSHHAKSGARDLLVIGATGFVNTKLDPDGSILIQGELWRARSNQGTVVAAANRVTVVGVQGHLLLVEPMSDKL
jgi:membrane-bound serine protease (ClpP class)